MEGWVGSLTRVAVAVYAAAVVQLAELAQGCAKVLVVLASVASAGLL